MAATTITPVAIGTRGTVGSLVRKEIDYFNKIDICGGSSKPVHSCSRPSFWSLKISWKRKKRSSGGSSRFISSICSAVEVADTNKLINGVPGFGYRMLNDELKEMKV